MVKYNESCEVCFGEGIYRDSDRTFVVCTDCFENKPKQENMTFFKRLQRKRELVDQEIELYRKEKILEVDKKIYEHQKILDERKEAILNLAIKCQDDTAKYEHTFHSLMEEKKSRIAELDAKIECLELVVKAREEVIAADNNFLKALQKEIVRQDSIIQLLIKKISSETHIHNSK